MPYAQKQQEMEILSQLQPQINAARDALKTEDIVYSQQQDKPENLLSHVAAVRRIDHELEETLKKALYDKGLDTASPETRRFIDSEVLTVNHQAHRDAQEVMAASNLQPAQKDLPVVHPVAPVLRVVK